MIQAKHILPLLIEDYVNQMKDSDFLGLEELRLVSGQPLRLCYGEKERELWPKVTVQMVEGVIQRACHQSAYAYSHCIRHGYLPLEGGHRMGICGFGVLEKGHVEHIRTPSSLCIRVAHEVPGFANDLLRNLCGSCLLLGPPGSGKTTLLRDTVRLLSDRRRQRISLVDERGELSAFFGGQPQLSIGSRTDVLVNVPKSQALMMLLRTMNPQWIAMDEVTAPEDLDALEQAAYCGVELLATAHGSSMEDLENRPLYQKLLKRKLFRQIVILRPDKSYEVKELTL